MRNYSSSFSLLSVSFILLLISISILHPTKAAATDSTSEGRDQLVDALNAAYVRVLSSGKWGEITRPIGKLVVNIADCYPAPDYAPFPENPTGILERILNDKQIKVGTYNPGETGSTGLHFEASGLLLEAIMDELGNAYGLTEPIEIIPVIIDPPSSTILYNALNDGTIDITDLFSALGGSNFGQLRRKIARFTCTVIASGWFLHVRDDSHYQSLYDFQEDENARICNVIMSTHLSRAYFPEQEINILIPPDDDIELCSQGVLDGIYDAYLHFDPVPAKTGLRSIDTGIVSGTPIWVAGDNATSPPAPEPEPQCPVSRTVSEDEQIKLLRKLRDNWLNNTAAANLVLIYYSNDLELSQILSKNISLRQKFKTEIKDNINIVKELLLKGRVTVDQKKIIQLTDFLNELKLRGSPKLKADIDFVIRGIQKGYLLKSTGINIKP